MSKKRWYLTTCKFIIAAIFLFNNNTGAQISNEFYRALPDSFKPKDPAKLTLPEKAKLLMGANVNFHLQQFNPELDKIADQLYLEVDKMPDKKKRIGALGPVACYTHRKFTQPDRALFYLNRLIKEINNDSLFSVALATSLLLKGTLLIEIGEMEQGIIALQDARKIISNKKEADEQQKIGHIYAALSNAYIQLELYDQAIAYINLAISYFNDMKSAQVRDLVINIGELNKASCYIGMYRVKNQPAYLDSSTAVIRGIMKLNAPRWFTPCYGLLARISYLKKQYPQSIAYLDSAGLPQYAKSDVTDDKFGRMAYRGLNLLRSGNIKEGNALIRKAINITNETYSPLSDLYYQLYETYKDNGDWKSASQYLKRYIDKKDSINVVRKNLAFADINEKYKSAQKEAQIQKLQTDQAVQKKQQRLTQLFAIVIVLSLLLIIILIYLFSRKALDRQAKKQQQLEKENLRISQSLMDQETKMMEERYESLRLLKSKISNDMHNELGGALVSFNFYLNDIQKSFKDEAVTEVLANIKEEANSIYIQTRNYIHDIQENVKDVKFDLVNFLLYLPLHFNESTTLKVQTAIEADQLETRLSTRQNNEFYLFIKEAIANILKHANATLFTIKVTFSVSNCEFSISDNGKGLDPDSVNPGLGIKNMQARISDLDGKLTMKSDKYGTMLSGFFPC